MLLPERFGVFVIKRTIIAWNDWWFVSVMTRYQRSGWAASIRERLNNIQIRCEWSHPVPKTSVVNKPIAHLPQELQFTFVPISPGEWKSNHTKTVLDHWKMPWRQESTRTTLTKTYEKGPVCLVLKIYDAFPCYHADKDPRLGILLCHVDPLLSPANP